MEKRCSSTIKYYFIGDEQFLNNIIYLRCKNKNFCHMIKHFNFFKFQAYHWREPKEHHLSDRMENLEIRTKERFNVGDKKNKNKINLWFDWRFFYIFFFFNFLNTHILGVLYSQDLFPEVLQVVKRRLRCNGVDQGKTLAVLHVQVPHSCELFLR